MTMVQAVTELATHGIIPDGALNRDDLIALLKDVRAGVGNTVLPVDPKAPADPVATVQETENPEPQEETVEAAVDAQKGPDTSEIEEDDTPAAKPLDDDDDLKFE